MGLDLPASGVHALGQAGHFEDGLLVPAGGDNVGVCLVLDAFDGGAFGPDDQADDSVGHAHLYGHVSGDVGGRAGRGAGSGAETCQVAFTRGADLREVLGGGKNLALCFGYVFLPSGYDEHGLFAADWRFYVGVRLGSQSFDLATCNK